MAKKKNTLDYNLVDHLGLQDVVKEITSLGAKVIGLKRLPTESDIAVFTILNPRTKRTMTVAYNKGGINQDYFRKLVASFG